FRSPVGSEETTSISQGRRRPCSEWLPTSTRPGAAKREHITRTRCSGASREGTTSNRKRKKKMTTHKRLGRLAAGASAPALLGAGLSGTAASGEPGPGQAGATERGSAT